MELYSSGTTQTKSTSFIENIFDNPVKYIIRSVVGIFLVVALASSFFTVDSGERGAVIRLGAIERVTGDGLHLKIPFIEDVKKFNVRLQKVDANGEGASKDLQSVHTTIALNYSLNGEKISWIYTNLTPDYPVTVIQPNINEIFKATTAKYNVEELITKREQVKNEIVTAIKGRLMTYNIVVDNVSITNFKFSEQFNKAIEQKQVAEQEALTAKNQLDRIKIEAEQKVAMAKAEAESLRLQKAEITPMMVELRKIEVNKIMMDKWNGQGNVVPQTVLGSSSGTIVNLK